MKLRLNCCGINVPETEEKEGMMERNRGFSLVELLVATAILSVVMMIALSFMMTGSRSFTKGSADSNVQKEAELTVNQIEDMIIDLNGGVSKDDDPAKTELMMYHAEDDGTGTMVYSKSAVRWDKNDQNVYCSKWDVSYDASTGTFADGAAEYADQLLAEHVTDFKVDLSDTLTTKAMDGTTKTIVKSVLISVGYDNGSGVVDYATSPVITLRNRMLLEDDPANIFDEVKPAADTMKLYYSGTETGGIVPIVDRVSEVKRGSGYNIYAKISTTNAGDVNDLVDWVIEETGTLSTIDANGYLTVGAYEANAYLTITATYKSNPNKKATGVVKVVGDLPLKSFDAVHIVTQSMEAFAPQFEAFPVTRGFTQAEEDAITYQWTVTVEGGGRELTDVVEAFTDNQKTLALTIKKEEANYGRVLVIFVEAYSDVTGQRQTDRLRYRIDTNGAVTGDANVKRGESALWRHYAMSDVYGEAEYKFYFCNQDGEQITVDPSLEDAIVLVQTSWNAYQFSVKETLPINQEYYVKVIGYYKGWLNGLQTTWTRERIHYIPAVQLYGKTCYNSFKFGNGDFTFDYTMIGYKELQLSAGENGVENSRVEYTIEDFDYSAPAGVSVTAKVIQDEAKGTNRVWARGQFECSDWSRADEVTLKSLTVRVAAKADRNINALVTIIFE